MGTLDPCPEGFDWMEGMDLLSSCIEHNFETLEDQMMPIDGTEEACGLSTSNKTLPVKPFMKSKAFTLRGYDAVSTAATIRKSKNKISAQKSRDTWKNTWKKNVELLGKTMARHEQVIQTMQEELATLGDRLNALTCQ